jgi:hypothetical protein
MLIQKVHLKFPADILEIFFLQPTVAAYQVFAIAFAQITAQIQSIEY